ncbi:MAG: class I SAM-dependent methyltransferase [Bdellovibrionota bacterium]|nr:MAG: class I SAM-dependent methyltransferase [Bdellovibrionota bacterium]
MKDSSNRLSAREFWEQNPLWAGESKFTVGSAQYFAEHREVVIRDCFAGKIDNQIFPESELKSPILDLGCGPGFWTIELGQRGFNVVAADLTHTALGLTKKRCDWAGIQARLCQADAQTLPFANESFAHVNCQGVIHHAPDPKKCVQEIARVLQPRGTAVISVYYMNLILKSWPMIRILASPFVKGLYGRGRESMHRVSDVNELVRKYDGELNPIGRAFSTAEFRMLVESHFEVAFFRTNFFPARALAFPIPPWIHSILQRTLGFIIYARLVKRN